MNGPDMVVAIGLYGEEQYINPKQKFIDIFSVYKSADLKLWPVE
jgi:hypothetical protein